jgi:hypothetical protein
MRSYYEHASNKTDLQSSHRMWETIHVLEYQPYPPEGIDTEANKIDHMVSSSLPDGTYELVEVNP